MTLQFEDIYATVRRHNPDANLGPLRRAYLFSAIGHRGQVRASGDPYLVHPLVVSQILADMRMDPSCVAVGLLHDVLEDTGTDGPRLERLFGGEVRHLVEGVTKIGQIHFQSSAERQAENFRKLLLAMVDDVRVILVKLADRLHNMRTLDFLPEERRQRIASETRDIYAPIAGRLGMSRIKNELEELCFRHLEPEAYETLTERVDQKREWATGLLTKLEETVAFELQEAGLEAELEGRIKRLSSIHQKLRRQQIELEQVYDFLALRIVVPTIPDCYAALGVLHNLWRPIPGRIKDFIAMPRPNGYQSLHTSVVGTEGQAFEVQIRTSEMHRIAEDGIAAHWKYKEGLSGFDASDDKFAWLRRLLELHSEVKDPSEFLASLKVDLYPEEVYCFTPGGDVKTLPRGATPVDFAYAIHTEVGHQCVGARINGKIVPLRYRLGNGDKVEVLTSKGHKPSRDWLTFVATNKARNKIRHFLNAAEKQKALEIGRKHLDRELRRAGVSPRKLHADPELAARLARDLGVGNKLDDLLAAVGYGKASVRQVLRHFVPEAELTPPPQDEPSPIADAVKRLLRVGGDRIKVSGVDDLLVYRARCCSPIRGESIVGYITRGKGVSVHSQECRNVKSLLYDPERRIAVEWEGGRQGGFEVQVSVEVEDRPGLLATITKVLADTGADIRKLGASTFDDETAVVELTLEVQDLKHLERVVRALRTLRGVIDVERHQAAG